MIDYYSEKKKKKKMKIEKDLRIIIIDIYIISMMDLNIFFFYNRIIFEYDLS